MNLKQEDMDDMPLSENFPNHLTSTLPSLPWLLALWCALLTITKWRQYAVDEPGQMADVKPFFFFLMYVSWFVFPGLPTSLSWQKWVFLANAWLKGSCCKTTPDSLFIRANIANENTFLNRIPHSCLSSNDWTWYLLQADEMLYHQVLALH